MIIIYMGKVEKMMNKLIKNMYNKQIFVDTSAWFSVMAKAKKEHFKIKNIYHELLENNNELITSNMVIGETFTLMRMKLKKELDSPFEFLELCKNSQKIKKILVEEYIEEDAIDILNKYKDHEISYIDATSFALMKDKNIDYALTLDSHFATIGFTIIK